MASATTEPVSRRKTRKRRSSSPASSLKITRVAEPSRDSLTLSEDEVERDRATKPLMSSSELARRPISVSSSSSLTTSTSSNEEVVDLTADSDNDSVMVVDLTKPLHRRTKPRNRRQRNSGATIVISEEDDDVIIVSPTSTPSATPPMPTATPSKPNIAAPLPSTTLVSVPTAPPPLPESPNSKDISCPICMDSKRTFVAAGRALVTTNCGHLFCEACIRKSIQLMHRCPTCSKKLTLKQYHKIFI